MLRVNIVRGMQNTLCYSQHIHQYNIVATQELCFTNESLLRITIFFVPYLCIFPRFRLVNFCFTAYPTAIFGPIEP